MPTKQPRQPRRSKRYALMTPEEQHAYDAKDVQRAEHAQQRAAAEARLGPPVLVLRTILPITGDYPGEWGSVHIMRCREKKHAMCGCITYPLEAAAVGLCLYGTEDVMAAQPKAACYQCVHRFPARLRLPGSTGDAIMSSIAGLPLRGAPGSMLAQPPTMLPVPPDLAALVVAPFGSEDDGGWIYSDEHEDDAYRDDDDDQLPNPTTPTTTEYDGTGTL